MTFWDEADMGTKIDPYHAATVLGNMMNILTDRMGEDPTELTAPEATPPAEFTPPETSTTSDTSTVRPYAGPESALEAGGRYGVVRGEGRAHGGQDFPMPSGTPILSMRAGTVVSAGAAGDAGNMVVVDHGNGITTRYLHLTNATVNPGDTVRAGEQIGLSGNTGDSRGPHLHFEVLENGAGVDPLAYLAGAGPIMEQEAVPKVTAAPTTPTVSNVSLTKDTRMDPITDMSIAEEPKPGAENKVAEAANTGTGDFFSQVLAGIGAPATAENLRALQAWARAEGMDAAHNNPFATTQGAAGARVLNDHGVKAYGDMATGVRATIETLMNGRYGNIIAALRAGANAMAVADAIENSPWGTGGLVKRILSA